MEDKKPWYLAAQSNAAKKLSSKRFRLVQQGACGLTNDFPYQVIGVGLQVRGQVGRGGIGVVAADGVQHVHAVGLPGQGEILAPALLVQTLRLLAGRADRSAVGKSLPFR